QKGVLELRKSKWHRREAYALSNGLIDLLMLTGGGHIVEMRFRTESKLPTMNPYWIPHWKTMDPSQYRPSLHARHYGPPAVGRTVAALAGHNICLDYFGAPSDEEAKAGLCIHGEAPNLRWRKSGSHLRRQELSLTLATRLPIAQLGFQRQITMRAGE